MAWKQCEIVTLFLVPAHLNEPLLLPPAQLREGVDDDAGEVHLDGVVLQRVADHRGVVVHVPTVQYSTVQYSTVQYSTVQYSTV